MNILSCYLPAEFKVGETGYVIEHDERYFDKEVSKKFPIGCKVTITSVKERSLNEFCNKCNNSDVCKQCLTALNKDGEEINNCIVNIDKVYR